MRNVFSEAVTVVNTLTHHYQKLRQLEVVMAEYRKEVRQCRAEILDLQDTMQDLLRDCKIIINTYKGKYNGEKDTR